MALWIKTDGRAIRVQPLDNKRFKTQELQRMVGGYIEAACRFPDEELVMYCNEEGKLAGLPENEKATVLFYIATGRLEVIAGDVVIATLRETGDEEESQ